MLAGRRRRSGISSSLRCVARLQLLLIPLCRFCSRCWWFSYTPRSPPFISCAPCVTVQGGTHSVAVDALVAERASLDSSHRLMDELSSVAGSVMSSLRSQRGVMKSAHKKVLDVSSVLGLSNTVMRLIERRTVADRMLVYGGMVFIMLLLALVWWLTR